MGADSAKRMRSDGERSRERILETAASLAAVDGLYRLSLARLARATGMSKSGVFGLFGSKEELQLAIIDRARSEFMNEVVEPSLIARAGVERLGALCERFLDYVERREWPSGCFFASVAAEVGGRTGAIRDRIADDQKQWVWLLTENARHALANRELEFDGEPELLALELSTMLTGADIAYLLHGDLGILNLIRMSIRSRLMV